MFTCIFVLYTMGWLIISINYQRQHFAFLSLSESVFYRFVKKIKWNLKWKYKVAENRNTQVKYKYLKTVVKYSSYSETLSITGHVRVY